MQNHAYLGPWSRLFRFGYLGFTVAVFLFLVAPILVIVPLSFSSGTFLSYPMPGLSLRWYEELWNSAVWMNALKNSMIVGSASMVLATILGTVASLGLVRSEFPFKGLVTSLLISPMIVPLVIAALGMYFFFARLGLNSTYTGLILAHTVLGAPFVVVTVTATLQGFNMNLMRAAASLGANPIEAFFRVMFPLILPGLVSGGLFAFATSFDEVVVVLFTAGPEQRTLPRQMFDGIRDNINPTITAVATILVVFSVALLSVLEILRRRGERLNAAKAD